MSTTVTITTEQKEVIKDYFKVYNKADSSSLKVFEVALDYFKINSGIKKATIKSNLIKEFKAIFSPDMLQTAFVSRLKKIIGIASEYNTFKVPYKDQEGEYKLYFYNIEGIVKLLEFVSKNEKDIEGNFKDIKAQIDEAIAKDDKKVAYNNNIKDVLTKIKQENGIKGEEDDLSLGFEAIKGALSKLSDEQLKAIIEASQKLLDK
jgi:hypothetical protein